MAASINYIKSSDGTGNANTATVQNPRVAPATTIQVDTVTGIPTYFCGTMGTPHTFSDPVTGEDITVISEATAVDFKGHVDGSNLEIDEIAPGYTDGGSAVGDIVIVRPTTQWSNNVAEVLEVAHEDDGKLKSDAPINGNQTNLSLVTPVGSILDYAGTTAPTGWLLCYGQTLDASTNTEYADLYAVIGNTYGGSDNTDFVVPDLRGRVAAGKDDMGGSDAARLNSGITGTTIGSAGGADTVNLAHQHDMGIGSDTTNIYWRRDGSGNPVFGSNVGTGSRAIAYADITGSGSYRSSLTDSKLSSSTTNIQPTIILNKIIKY